MSPSEQSTAMERSLRAICAEVAGRNKIAAACEWGESVYSPRPERHHLLIILEDYWEGLRYHSRRSDGQPVTILAADRSLVDLDVRKGAMGEFIVERLLTPYRPVQNEATLRSIEVDAKQRVMHEELAELVSEYGEMARELSIKEEYLMLARIRKRARIFLPAARTCALLLHPSVRDANLKSMGPGYRTAIGKLVDAGILRRDASAYSLEDSFVDHLLTGKSTARVINVVQSGRRALQAYLAHGRAAYLTPDVLTRELFSSLELGLSSDIQPGDLEDPKKYLSLKTAAGQASLAERFSIEEFAGRFRRGAVVTVSPLGDVLNEVYLITAGDERLVAKKFTEWQGFKWFTLGLVSLGTKLFSVSGKARLENEYATNRHLSRLGVPVPEILHVSVKDRVLVERYIEGSSLVELAKRAASSNSLADKDVTTVVKVGSTLSKVHAAKVAMGDTKPENFQRSTDGEVYCLDLEQAKKSGDKAWDVAEFLYYSGHYVFPAVLSNGFKEYVASFVQGYRIEGDESVLKAAAGVRYSRVFSLWTPPLVTYEISRALRKPA